MHKTRYSLAIILIISCLHVFARVDTIGVVNKKDAYLLIADSAQQRDMIDVIQKVLNRNTSSEKRKLPKKVNLSIIPTVGYTLSTGFAVGISTVTTFYTQPNHNLNISVINAQAFYDSHSQETFFTQANIWADKDNFKLVTDLRLVKYPDVTYGLGSTTKSTKAEPIDYDYLRFYQTVLKKVIPKLYAGLGYNLDYHFNIVDHGTDDNTGSAFRRYGRTASSRSSGVNFDLLFDNRNNPVNALQGVYANAIYRHNYTALGSDVDWSSLVLDVRKYIKLSEHSNNVLAFWSYDWITLTGKEPYLDLPSVGADMYNNTGRGYAIDRYRGRSMLYVETEFRYGITKNGLLGGVVFANAGHYAKTINDNLRDIIPAGGAGLRLKINKHSNTNLCVDYGVGVDGSRGFFVNLGEVF